jgi:glucosamine--fructose-6-phosphate aminotransferase (isomerizing)
MCQLVTALRHGYVFESETDTEVIPKLTKYLFDKFHTRVTFRQLVMEVVRQLHGAFALIFKSSHYPGELVAAKRGSPLLMGIVEQDPGSTHAALASVGLPPLPGVSLVTWTMLAVINWCACFDCKIM